MLWCSQRIFWAVRTFNCQRFPVVVIIFYLIVMIKGGWWEVQGGHVNLPWLWKGPCWCSWVEYRGDIYFVRNILRQIVVYCGGVKPWIYDLIFKGTFCVLNFWNVDLQKVIMFNFEVICENHANACYNVSKDNLQDDFLTEATACFCDGDLWDFFVEIFFLEEHDVQFLKPNMFVRCNKVNRNKSYL